MTHCHELGDHSVEITPKCFLQLHLPEFDVIWSKLFNQNKELQNNKLAVGSIAIVQNGP